jgi:hypothetical protein
MREAVIRLGSAGVTIAYPRALAPWLDGLAEPANDGAPQPAGSRDAARRNDALPCVRLCPAAEPECFDMIASRGKRARGLALGEALAALWERVSFFLLDDLADAFALHAAALRCGEAFVLLPGRTGSGKSRLALWYRRHGLELGTDEIVTFSAGDEGSGAPDAPLLEGALARPVILKPPVDVAACLVPQEEPLAQCESDYGLLLRLHGMRPWTARPIARGLIVFPRFVAGAPLKLSALSPGEAALQLLESCLNARNLPRGGLAAAAALARRLPALALEYGDSDQLDGTLDVLTRQLLAARPSAEDLAALCAAFTAAAAARTPVVAQPRAVPAPTVARFPRRLTVGMATYDDYDGVYFTIQSLRMSNPGLEGEVEFVVVDNNPGGAASEALSRLGKWIDGYRYVPRGDWNGTAVRNAVFEEASSNLVLCIDSHVLVAPGALARLIDYHEADPDSRDLFQGPLIYDDLRRISTHMEPKWRAGMYGVWADDPRGADPTAPAFEIPMHGLGLFACRRTAWAGFNALFRGFGGEEGYIHEKMRRYGGRTLCLPFLRWLHRFERPLGPPYVNRWDDRMRNYYIAFTELGLDTAEMEAHFAELLGAETAARIWAAIKSELRIG